MDSITCHVCDRKFTRQSNLYRHLRKVHLEANPSSRAKSVWNYKCLEENCDISFPRNSGLVNHLKDSHNMNFEDVEVIAFKTRSEFESWKTNFERNNKCNYAIVRACRHTKGRVIYYNCNRSNRTKTTGKVGSERQRRTKSQGSCKLGFGCTSYMKLCNNGDELMVYLQKTHYGHSLDLQHLRLSKQEKALIASKLISGVPGSEIINSTRDQIEDSLKRIDLLTPKDIDNIKRSYNINRYIKDGKRRRPKKDDGAVSFDFWIQEYESMPPDENPVLFYKRPDDPSDTMGEADFCLVIMNKFQETMLKKFGNNVISVDRTRLDVSNYMELTSIQVLDEFEQGFPVAFMFSNKEDTRLYKQFFETIQQKVGKGTINPRIFLSDVTDSAYNAWIEVMGPAANRLFSLWHVKMDWQTNLAHIDDEVKRMEIFNALKELQEESNQSDFEHRLKCTINFMSEDSDRSVRDFCQYFEVFYTDNCEQWALYARKLLLNINVNLELTQEVIKFKKTGNWLQNILKFIREKSVDRVIKLVKGKDSTNRYHEEIHKRHHSGMDGDFVVDVRNDGWKLWDESEDLMIKKHLDASCCCLTCPDCNVCLHMYSCTCNDYTFNFKICKHIHYLVMLIRQSDTTYQDEDELELSDESKFEVFQVEIVEGSDSEQDAKRLENKEPVHQDEDQLSVNDSTIEIDPEEEYDCSDSDQSIIETNIDGGSDGSLSNDLTNEINKTFVKLNKSDLNKFSDSTTASEILMHLEALKNLVSLANARDDQLEQKYVVIPKLKVESTEKEVKRQHVDDDNRLSKRRKI